VGADSQVSFAFCFVCAMMMARYFALVGSATALTRPNFTLWFGNK